MSNFLSINKSGVNVIEATVSSGEGVSLPSGLIMAYGGMEAPQGWLLCDGSVLSRSEYQDLFNVIGTAYGSDDGLTFKLPNLNGVYLKGGGVGQIGGSLNHQHLDHDLSFQHDSITIGDHPVLTHTGVTVGDHAAKSTDAAGVGATQRGTTTSTLTLKAHVHNISAYSHSVTQPGDHSVLSHTVSQLGDHDEVLIHDTQSNEPPFVTVNYIIKT